MVSSLRTFPRRGDANFALLAYLYTVYTFVYSPCFVYSCGISNKPLKHQTCLSVMCSCSLIQKMSFNEVTCENTYDVEASDGSMKVMSFPRRLERVLNICQAGQFIKSPWNAQNRSGEGPSWQRILQMQRES